MPHSITLELPDDLYQKFKKRSLQTNRSLEEELLTAFVLDLPLLPLDDSEELTAYQEVLEFLSSGPSVAEIAAFQLSAQARERARDLVEQNKAESLTLAENKELDFYVTLGDFLGVLRAKAQLHLQGQIGS
jgi:hypothetical protein